LRINSESYFSFHLDFKAQLHGQIAPRIVSIPYLVAAGDINILRGHKGTFALAEFAICARWMHNRHMKRINAYFTDQQVAAMQAVAGTSGHKVSELLRRAVDMYLERMYQRGLITKEDLPPPVDDAVFADLPATIDPA
jgi:hypothetical protein